MIVSYSLGLAAGVECTREGVICHFFLTLSAFFGVKGELSFSFHYRMSKRHISFALYIAWDLTSRLLHVSVDQ